MVDNASLISRLPPQKRAELFRQLRAPAMHPPASAQRYEVLRIGDGRNFRLSIGATGILDSLTPKQAPRRAPNPGEVEIEVRAAGLNFRDVMVVLGLYPSKPDTAGMMGTDWAGRVVSVGEGVTRFQPGDEVMGLVISDFSPYVTCSESRVVRKPAALSCVEAAAIPTAFLTSYYALHQLAQLQRGERVLIHSAAGGVGLAAIQFAKWKEAEIFATAGNQQKREYLRGLGIRHVFDSHAANWAEKVMESTGGEGVDIVLNSLIGNAIAQGLSVLRDSGRFVEIGMRPFYSDEALPLRSFSRCLSFITAGVGVSNFAPEQRKTLVPRLLEEITALFDSGLIRLPPTRVYPFPEFANAFAFLSQGVHIGKVVLDMWNQEISVQL